MATKTKTQAHVRAITGAVALLLTVHGSAVLVLPARHLLVLFSLSAYKENELGRPSENGLKIKASTSVDSLFRVILLLALAVCTLFLLYLGNSIYSDHSIKQPTVTPNNQAKIIE